MIATNLLNSSILKIKKKNYRICELEFYLKEKDHNDIFTHCDVHQNIPYRWYFHRQNCGNYKSGTYEGLDITFGYMDDNKQKDVYGGILIRSIQDLDSKQIIEGPCKTVNKILEINKVESINDFIKNSKQNSDENDILRINNPNLSLHVVNNNVLNSMVVFCGPRVGLTLRRCNSIRQKYIMKNYRFLIYPNKIKKFRSSIVINLDNEGFTHNDIEKIVGIKKHYIEKYITSAKEGHKKTFKDFNKKSLTSTELCMLQGLYLKN